jgi:outer membrane protein assembly factor BamB
MNIKKSAILIAILLISTIATTLVSTPLASGQTSGQMSSYAYLIVEPNPVGVGQTTYIAMIVDVPLPSASEANDIRRHNYQLIITAPDGTNQTKSWDRVADTTGVQSTSFTPDQVGTYTFTFNYPDQNYTWTTGAQGGNAAYLGVIFLAASATATLTVQQDAVAATSDSPLPTEYWTRPIYGEDYNWYIMGSHWLAGNFLGTFQQSGQSLWQQSGTGPDTSHIMWTAPLEEGGVVGGLNTGITGATYYSGGSYEGRLQNAIIMNGKIYYKSPLGSNVSAGISGTNGVTPSAYICRDLRTGQILWTNDNIYPTFGELYDYESPNQHGVLPNGILWQTFTPVGSTNQTWIAYDADTGKWLFNLTDVPATGTIAYTSQGEIVKYVLNYNTNTKTGWLALWNWTSANGVPASSTSAYGVQLNGPGSGTNYLQWRPLGRSINTSTAYSWNVSITADLTGSLLTQNPTIQYVLPGDLIFGTTPSVAPGVLSLRGTPNPFQVWTLSLADSNKGSLIWKKTFDAPSGNMTRNLGPLDPVNRVWTMTDAETFQWLGFSLADGSKLWGPTTTVMRPMQWFSSGSGAGQRATTAYGNIYTQGFGGEMFCYDSKTGTLLWKFNDTNSGVDTSWGLIPIFIAAIADGKVYAFNNEHSPNSPLYKGYSIYAINATTGEEIYKLLSWSGQSGGQGLSTAVLADGTLCYYNYYDNQLYAIAKGPSQTTVTASPKVSVFGDKVLVEGKVTDISAGTKQNEQAVRFPAGVPAVADASMSAWMEYVYMKQEKPTNATGIPITVSVIDPNGNNYPVGTTTSDASGAFKLAFNPQVPGEYTIIASFTGTGSYYGSSAETAVYVGEAHATATPTPTPVQSMADLYLVPGIIGIIIAIIAVGAVIIIALRKRP